MKILINYHKNLQAYFNDNDRFSHLLVEIIKRIVKMFLNKQIKRRARCNTNLKYENDTLKSTSLSCKY